MALCLCAGVFGSCLKKKTSPYTDYKLESSFRYPIMSEPPTLDWSKGTDSTSFLIIQNIMEGLTEYDFSSSKPELKSALAERWESSNNKKTWRFFLKKGLVWTDGRPLTADHFIDAWERLLNPATGGEYAYFLFSIKNAQAYNQGKIKDFSQVGAKRGPQGELIVHLERGLAHFPYLLSHPSTFPLRKDRIKKFPLQWTNPKHLISLGPYQLSRWDHDKALILTENAHYHGKKPSIKKILIYIVPDETGIMNLYSSGKLDIALPLISRDLPLLKQRPDHKSHKVLSLYYYGFNVKDPILKNPLVRKALIHAVDRKEIVKLLNRGDRPSKSWIPQGLFAENQDIGLGFDPAKARQLLKSAGYDLKNRRLKLKIFYNTTTDHKMIAENIQSQLRRNLKLRVELNNQEWKSYLHKLKIRDVQIFRLGWQADYPDPHNFMNLMTSISDNNHTGWKNLRYDELVLKAGAEGGGQKKLLYDEAQRILLEEDASVWPLFTSVQHVLLSPRVKKYPLNSMSYVLFKEVELNK